MRFRFSLLLMCAVTVFCAHTTASAAEGAGSFPCTRQILAPGQKPPTIQWKTYIESPSVSEFSALVPLPDGGVLVAGTLRNSEGDNDSILIRLNTGGVEVWNRRFKDRRFGTFSDGVALADGGAVLTGRTERNENETSADIFALRIDRDGHTLWENTFDIAEEFDFPTSIAALPGDHVVIGGSGGSGNLDDENNVFVLCLDEKGEEAWRKIIEPVDEDPEGTYVKSLLYDRQADRILVVHGPSARRFMPNHTTLLALSPEGEVLLEASFDEYAIEGIHPNPYKLEQFFLRGFQGEGDGVFDPLILSLDQNLSIQNNIGGHTTGDGLSALAAESSETIITYSEGLASSGVNDLPALYRLSLQGEVLWQCEDKGYDFDEFAPAADGAIFMGGPAKKAGAQARARLWVIKTVPVGR